MTDTYWDTSYPPSIWTPEPTPPPTLIAINPATGVTATNVAITCTGTGFVAGSQIKVDGVAIPTTVVSETSVTGTVATGAVGTRQITVSNANGTSGARPFTVTAAEIADEPTTETFTAVPVEEVPPDS